MQFPSLLPIIEDRRRESRQPPDPRQPCCRTVRRRKDPPPRGTGRSRERPARSPASRHPTDSAHWRSPPGKRPFQPQGSVSDWYIPRRTTRPVPDGGILSSAATPVHRRLRPWSRKPPANSGKTPRVGLQYIERRSITEKWRYSVCTYTPRAGFGRSLRVHRQDSPESAFYTYSAPQQIRPARNRGNSVP